MVTGGYLDVLRDERLLTLRRDRQASGLKAPRAVRQWKSAPESPEPRLTVLARTSSNCKRQTHSVVRENVT
jgi:hypothetical protein